MIRDAEIESYLRAYIRPVFRAAGLHQNLVKVHVVNDSRINAFVAGGRHMFINTGLLISSPDPTVVIGVMAHETGHIVGGHLVQLRAAIQEAQIRSIIAFLLGAVAAAASRDSRVGTGVILLGQRVTEGTFFKYTQGQEQVADQYAIKILDRLGISAKGLRALLEKLRGQELLTIGRQDPYLRTHPLTRDRIEAIDAHLKKSKYTNARLSPALMVMHSRMRAKLIGFLAPPQSVIDIYGRQPKTSEARYALAVAYHRNANLPKSLALIDSLLRENPRDPFFHELRGQILFESGRPADAAKSYAVAVKYAPNEPLIRVGYAQALLEADTPAANRLALANLKEATRIDDTYPLGWRLLGIAYGKQRNMGMASLALAEYYLLIGDIAALKGSVARADRMLPRGSPAWQRVQDIKSALREYTRSRRQ